MIRILVEEVVRSVMKLYPENNGLQFPWGRVGKGGTKYINPPKLVVNSLQLHPSTLNHYL